MGQAGAKLPSQHEPVAPPTEHGTPAVPEDKLPLPVAKAPPGQITPRSVRGLVLSRLRYAPFVLVPFFLGGIVGLYFQPPGLQYVMTRLGLQPGGGTKTPIAVPVSKAQPATRPGELSPPSVGAQARPVTVAGLGKLVPQGQLITLAPPYGAGDSRIAELRVDEGARVDKGAILAIMDNEPGLKAAVASAQAALDARQATLTQVKEFTIASREESRAALVRAQAALANATRDFERSKELRARGFTPEATFDSKRAAFEQAAQDVAKAKVTLSRYASDSLESQPDVVIAASNVEAARAELVRALADVEKAYVRAPLAATVLTIHVRAGEKPGSLGVMNLGNIDEMTAEIEIYQTQIGQVEVGAPVTITADALARPFKGTVSRVGLEVGKQTVTDASPAANTDARVVKVYVALAPADLELARRFTSLQVTARIATGGGK